MYNWDVERLSLSLALVFRKSFKGASEMNRLFKNGQYLFKFKTFIFKTLCIHKQNY